MRTRSSGGAHDRPHGHARWSARLCWVAVPPGLHGLSLAFAAEITMRLAMDLLLRATRTRMLGNQQRRFRRSPFARRDGEASRLPPSPMRPLQVRALAAPHGNHQNERGETRRSTRAWPRRGPTQAGATCCPPSPKSLVSTLGPAATRSMRAPGGDIPQSGRHRGDFLRRVHLRQHQGGGSPPGDANSRRHCRADSTGGKEE